MATGTVRWFDKQRGYGLITPDDGSEDLLAYTPSIRRSGLARLWEGQRVSYKVIDSPEGKQVSEIYHTPDLHSALNVEEREVDGPEPVERILYFNSDPLAVAYLDKPQTEATLAWPLVYGAPLRPVLDRYLLDFLPRYYPRPSENTLEMWIGDRYYQKVIGSEPTSRLVIDNLLSVRERERESLGLLQISSDSVILEILFDKSIDRPARLALLISAVPVRALARLFSSLHKYEIVRENHDVATYAVAPNPPTNQGSKSLLYPLPVIPEE